jgi:predicted nucleic acid-binding protein
VANVAPVAQRAVAGIAEFPMDDTVLRRARVVGADHLPSLEAVHLASALAVDADAMLTYDDRLADSASAVGITVLAPD